jgi:hypothetical protein
MRKAAPYLRAELSRRYAAPDWAVKKRACFDAYDWACFVCGNDWKGVCFLQCHHLTYARLWRESPSDLVPLCERHHTKGRIEMWQLKIRRRNYRIDGLTRRVLGLLWRGICRLAGRVYCLARRRPSP